MRNLNKIKVINKNKHSIELKIEDNHKRIKEEFKKNLLNN
jgi:hypothetical protein